MVPVPVPDDTPITLEIPNGNEVNQLIGVKGANITRLQSETGTHIAVQKANEVMPGVTVRQVTISGGNITMRQHCASRILSQVAEFRGPEKGATPQLEVPTAEAAKPEDQSVIEIPNGPEVNFIIGRSGASINALQAETGTHIAVQRAADVKPGVAVRVVTITGPETQRMRCIALIRAKVLEYQFSNPASSVTGVLAGVGASGGGDAAAASGGELVISIPNGMAVNHVIGAKGMTINALQNETGTHIAVQKASEVAPGCMERIVTISGGADEAARERCAELIRGKVGHAAHHTSATTHHPRTHRPPTHVPTADHSRPHRKTTHPGRGVPNASQRWAPRPRRVR